jgi:SAM domain (Sterile alpha motif)
MDLGGWLRSLGLEKYEAAFRENEIDETVLASLTHETLREIGVTPVGHRLKLLDSIAALCTDASAKPPYNRPAILRAGLTPAGSHQLAVGAPIRSPRRRG